MWDYERDEPQEELREDGGDGLTVWSQVKVAVLSAVRPFFGRGRPLIW